MVARYSTFASFCTSRGDSDPRAGHFLFGLAALAYICACTKNPEAPKCQRYK